MKQKLFPILVKAEFFLKVAIACNFIQQIIGRILGPDPLGFVH